MLKVPSREALDELAGRRRPVAVPVPAGTPDSSSAALAGLAEAGQQLAAAAQQLALAAQARPKQLEAIVQRDSEGRMEKVIINVL